MCLVVALRPEQVSSAVPRSGPVSSSSAPSSPSSSASTLPREVLLSWDVRRAAAWAEGDVEALRELYVDGSASGRRDAAMLGEYAARGLVVEGMRTQLLALAVVDRTPGRLRLRVTDRVVGGVVREASRPEVATLPVDQASTRVVVLRRVRADWLVVEVRDDG